MISASGETKLVPWRELREAANANYQPDEEVRLVYAELLRQAEKMIRATPPISIEGRHATGSVYRVVGEGIDGSLRPIAAFVCLKLAADEGMDHDTLLSATREAAAIARRNRLRS